MNIRIRNITHGDWPSIASIYQQGIATGIATFETKIPTWQQWDRAHIQSCRLGALLNNSLVGWAALAQVSSRSVYSGVAEVSIYIDSTLVGKGIGSKLFERLIIESEKEGFWTLQSAIFPENIGSIKLHHKMGFRKIGYRENIGKRNGIWHDSVLMERRSKTVGVLLGSK